MKSCHPAGLENKTVLCPLCAYMNVYSHMVCVEMWSVPELTEDLVLGSAHRSCVKLFLFNK